jgi:tartronate-semialdehyde synthase
MLRSDFVFGIGNRWANRHTGSVETYTKDRKFIHVDIEPTQIGRVFAPDFGIVSDAKAALEQFIAVAKDLKKAGKLKDRGTWSGQCAHRKEVMLRKSHYDEVPLKPQRVYEEMNSELDRDTCYVTTIGLSQIAGAQFLHVYNPRNWINCGQAGPLGWTLPAALGVRAALPDKKIVALSGDYDFQFLIEELAVGAQHKLPYLHIVVNNSYLGLIRQAQRGFEMDFEVSLAFENINASDDGDALPGYGVDHVAVAEGLGCKAIRVKSPNEFKEAFARAQELMDEHQVPVVLEFILERVTNIAMGMEIDAVNEFEDILCLDPELSLETPVDLDPVSRPAANEREKQLSTV